MCIVIYLGSNSKPELIPWDEKARRFNVQTIKGPEKTVTKHFSKKHIVYIGSSLHCGCGFRSKMDPNDPGEFDDSQLQDHEDFSEYLIKLMQSEQEIEVYSCWSGNEYCNVKYKRKIKISEIQSDQFGFLENEFLIISK